MFDPAADPDWYIDNVMLPSGPKRRRLGRVGEWRGYWSSAHHRLLTSGDVLSALAARQGFVVSTEQARAAGVDAALVRRNLRRGEWWRPARGAIALVPEPVADPLAPGRFLAQQRRHALVAAAQALVRPNTVTSGPSGAVLHGLPVLRIPDLPVFTSLRDPTQGRRQTVHLRSARLPAAEVSEWFGVPVTTAARTIVDLARIDERDGIMAADAALREGAVSRRELDVALGGCAGWPGARAARLVVALADPLAESPLESVTRLVLFRAGFPPPELQAEFDDPVTGRTFRVDMLFRDRGLVLEADGRVKYTGDELWREKQRQLALSRLGLRFERVTWADVSQYWPVTEERLRRYWRPSPPR